MPVARGGRSARFQRAGEEVTVEESEDEPSEVPEDDGEEVDSEEDAAVLEVADEDLGADDGDEGQGAHNEKVTRTVRERAIAVMREKGVMLDDDESRIALQIFPRVSHY